MKKRNPEKALWSPVPLHIVYSSASLHWKQPLLRHHQSTCPLSARLHLGCLSLKHTSKLLPSTQMSWGKLDGIITFFGYGTHVTHKEIKNRNKRGIEVTCSVQVSDADSVAVSQSPPPNSRKSLLQRLSLAAQSPRGAANTAQLTKGPVASLIEELVSGRLQWKYF